MKGNDDIVADMKTETSHLQTLRGLVRHAARHGGRVDLLTCAYIDNGKRTGNAQMVLGNGEHLQDFNDLKGPLTEIFIEQTARRSRPESLVSEVFTRPTRSRREQYFDIKSVTVQGKDVRLGVEVVVDDRGEQRRTYFVEGPSLIRRWGRNVSARLHRRKSYLPPDNGDIFS